MILSRRPQRKTECANLALLLLQFPLAPLSVLVHCMGSAPTTVAGHSCCSPISRIPPEFGSDNVQSSTHQTFHDELHGYAVPSHGRSWTKAVPGLITPSQWGLTATIVPESVGATDVYDQQFALPNPPPLPAELPVRIHPPASVGGPCPESPEMLAFAWS